MSVAVPDFLYHGSIVEFSRPDVTKRRGFKDFGKGFYMSADRRQAIGMMHKKFSEAVSTMRLVKMPQPAEVLYRIELDRDVFPALRTRVFARADAEWLDFVLACRRSDGVPHDYDVIIGPTADDDTRLLIKNYLDGVYGDPFEPESRETLLRLLKPERLGIQWYVGRQGVADRLIRRFEVVDWRECL